MLLNLQKFNKKNGWYTSWSKLARDNEIYSLVIKGAVDIQGLVANEQLERHYVDNFDAIRIHMLHPYQILITEDAGKRIKEAYTYEWKDDEL